MNHLASKMIRKGARRKNDVPPPILARLAAGEIETVNLMEWLAVDMSALALSVSKQVGKGRLASALRSASKDIAEKSITERLQILGSAVTVSGVHLDDPDFVALSGHRSDLVRQWACYGVNDPMRALSLRERLRRTLTYASDQNMTVREAAWMAFRPHLQRNLTRGLELLQKTASHADANRRRFAVEVSRPRSVWGAHISQLKREPGIAEPLLDEVREDSSRYVQLAAGNWINDAAKSRPDWVVSLCDRWMRTPAPQTRKIVLRGLRTLRSHRLAGRTDLFPAAWPPSLQVT
jgi:3-methyladenine DNA glycosylase AlkC